MPRPHDAFLTTDAFQLALDANGIVDLSFGPTRVAMTVDSAYDLQYRLAAFLAHLELRDSPPGYSCTDRPEDSHFSGPLAEPANLADYRAVRKLDS